MPAIPWNNLAEDRAERLIRRQASCLPGHKVCHPAQLRDLLHAVSESGDRVVIEAANQKQADLLAAGRAALDPARVNDLHVIQPVLALPERRSPMALGAVAGDTPFGRKASQPVIDELRARGIVAVPEDPGIDRAWATNALLAAQDMRPRPSFGRFLPALGPLSARTVGPASKTI